MMEKMKNINEAPEEERNALEELSVLKRAFHILKKLFNMERLGLITALIAMIIIFSVLTGNKYIRVENIINILVAGSIVGLVTIGESYLLISGQVDLSPGSVAAFSGVLVCLLLTWGIPVFAAIAIVGACGLLIGFFNSCLVNYIKLEPFIATLASMSIFRGFAYIICGGKSIFVTDRTFLAIGSRRVFGVLPIPVIFFIITFAVFTVILNRTRFGRNVYMVGGNATAARLAGINAQKLRTKLYMMTSCFAALGGCILASRMSSGQPMASQGLEFDAVTAAVLGGIPLAGGFGTLGGAFIGLLIMQGFNNGLMMMNVPSFWQTVGRGALLIIALSFDYLRKMRRK